MHDFVKYFDAKSEKAQKLLNNGIPSPTRTDINRSSTDFESVALGLKPLITLTFIVCINVLYNVFFQTPRISP